MNVAWATGEAGVYRSRAAGAAPAVLALVTVIVFVGCLCGCAGSAPKYTVGVITHAGAETDGVARSKSRVISNVGHRKNCIRRPSTCGYPDATNTGVRAGTVLTRRSGDLVVSTPGTVIANIALSGTIDVEADHTTVDETDITVDGTQDCGSSCGGKGIWIKPGVSGTVIQDVTCHGGAPTGKDVTQYCIMNDGSSTRIRHVHAYNCTECLTGAGNVSDSFIDESGAAIPGEHYEDIYYGGGASALIVNHNTMLNPQGQTAVVFASVDFGDQTTLRITNNLMAGGGYVIYGGGSGSAGKVLGPVTVSGNRFSRRYYRNGGYYGTDAYVNDAVTTWSKNVWDETLRPVGE